MRGIAAVLRDRPLHGAPVPWTRLHPRLYAAEFAGTFLLVVLGVSIVIAMFGEGSALAALLPFPASQSRSENRERPNGPDFRALLPGGVRRRPDGG